MKLFNVYYQVFGHPDPKINRWCRSFLLKSPNQTGASNDAHDQLERYCTKNELWDYELLSVDEIPPEHQFDGKHCLGLEDTILMEIKSGEVA